MLARLLAGSKAFSSASSRSTDRPPPYQGVTLHVEVALRAFMPTCNTAALSVGLRMAERMQQFEQYAQYWTCRPQVPVASNAALWWQHAGRAAVSQCRLLTRSQVCSLARAQLPRALGVVRCAAQLSSHSRAKARAICVNFSLVAFYTFKSRSASAAHRSSVGAVLACPSRLNSKCARCLVAHRSIQSVQPGEA